MSERYQPTHKDAVVAAILQYGLTVMPTPRLPSAALEHILLKDTVFVRGPNSREMVDIVFSGLGDIESFRFPSGTFSGALAELTEVTQVPEGDPLLEPISSAYLLALLNDVVFPEMAS